MIRSGSVLLRTIKWVCLLCIGVVFLFIGHHVYVYWSFDTDTFPENHGRVHSQLYLAEGEQQPLVVVLGGSSGGNQWTWDSNTDKRALFRENGYATLAVGYFGMEGIPENLDRIAIEGVHKAVMEAARHPSINGDCVVLIGISRGSVLALLLGSHYREYASVVAIVPGSCVFFAATDAMNTPAYSHNGKPLPFVPLTWNALPSFARGKYREGFERIMKNTAAVRNAAIPVESINGPILFISAARDEVWPSMEMANSMMERLDAEEFPHAYEHLILEGGHEEFQYNFADVIRFLEGHLDCRGAKDFDLPR